MPKSQLDLVAPVPDENSVKRAVIAYLLYRGCLVLRVNSGAAAGQYQDQQGNVRKRFLRFAHWYAGGISEKEGRAGISDIIALWLNPDDGVSRLIAVETKTPQRKDEVTDAQRRFMAEVERRGGIAVVASDVSDVQAALESAGRRGEGG